MGDPSITKKFSEERIVSVVKRTEKNSMVAVAWKAVSGEWQFPDKWVIISCWGTTQESPLRGGNSCGFSIIGSCAGGLVRQNSRNSLYFSLLAGNSDQRTVRWRLDPPPWSPFEPTSLSIAASHRWAPRPSIYPPRGVELRCPTLLRHRTSARTRLRRIAQGPV